MEGLGNIVGQFFPNTWYNERLSGTLQKEVLKAEWSYITKQAQVTIYVWFRQYKRPRPQQALKMKQPVPETLLENTKFSGTEKWD